MNPVTSTAGLEDAVATSLRQRLLRLAALEDSRAATEAARVSYWESCPASVLGHRTAATALRAEADRVVEPFALPTSS
jgi:hypothetical protein